MLKREFWWTRWSRSLPNHSVLLCFRLTQGDREKRQCSQTFEYVHVKWKESVQWTSTFCIFLSRKQKSRKYLRYFGTLFVGLNAKWQVLRRFIQIFKWNKSQNFPSDAQMSSVTRHIDIDANFYTPFKITHQFSPWCDTVPWHSHQQARDYAERRDRRPWTQELETAADIRNVQINTVEGVAFTGMICF